MNPNDISPTPRSVYEPRIFTVRIWVPGGPFEGVGFLFKAPYGTSIMASEILARAVARQQITRFTFGAASRSMLRRRRAVTSEQFRRFEPAFSAVGQQLGIEWAA